MTIAPPVTPLRGNRRFRLLWTGSAIGFLGVEVADIGYPLAILAITGSPADAGLFGAVQMFAGLLMGLVAGNAADRHDRRRILLCAEGTRALTTTTTVVALFVGEPSLPYLLGVAAVLGGCAPFSGVTRLLLVRAVVPDTQQRAAMTGQQLCGALGQLAGRPLGGVLHGLHLALPFLFSAVLFTLAWAAALFIRVPPADDARPTRIDLWSGVRILVRDPVLRPVVLVMSALGAAGAPLPLLAMVVLREQSTAPWAVGFTMAGLAVGGLAGTALVGPLHRRFPPGVLVPGIALLEVPLLCLLPLPLGPWWIAAVLCCAMLGVPALNVLIDLLAFARVPDEQRGRVIAAALTSFAAGTPAAIALAGLLLQHFPASVTALVFACLLAVSAMCALVSRALRTTRLP